MGVGGSEKIGMGVAVFLTFLLSFMGASVAHAQVTGATLSGTVTDPSGGVVVGAQVAAKDSATGITKEVTTDSAGLFTLPNLVPSSYESNCCRLLHSGAIQSHAFCRPATTAQLRHESRRNEYDRPSN
jgi:hypothetical protein